MRTERNRTPTHEAIFEEGLVDLASNTSSSQEAAREVGEIEVDETLANGITSTLEQLENDIAAETVALEALLRRLALSA